MPGTRDKKVHKTKDFTHICHCYSVTQAYPTLWDPMDYSMPDLPVLHCLLEFVQIHVHWVDEAIHKQTQTGKDHGMQYVTMGWRRTDMGWGSWFLLVYRRHGGLLEVKVLSRVLTNVRQTKGMKDQRRESTVWVMLEGVWNSVEMLLRSWPWPQLQEGKAEAGGGNRGNQGN